MSSVSRPFRAGLLRTSCLNYSLRKIIKTRGHFPSEEAATKLLYLALVRAEQRWTRPLGDWKNALNQFAGHFDGRLPI